jgi:hypothetical protein
VGCQIHSQVRSRKYTQTTPTDVFLVDVAIGSRVTIRHVNTQGGYLHSHSHNYPGGSQRTYLFVLSISLSDLFPQSSKLHCIHTLIRTMIGVSLMRRKITTPRLTGWTIQNWFTSTMVHASSSGTLPLRRTYIPTTTVRQSPKLTFRTRCQHMGWLDLLAI